MGRACLIWITIFLLIVNFVFAADPNPSLTASQQAGSSGVVSALVVGAISDMEVKLAEDMKAYNDENFRQFDARMADYMVKFTEDATTRAIMGILGLNALVAGAIFYFMNKQNRKMSYDSYLLRTKQSEEDRKYMADSINALRTKVEYVEQEASKKFDLSIVPMEILDSEMRRRYDESYGQYAVPQQQQFDNSFVEQQNGGVQDEWRGQPEYQGFEGYAQAPYDAMAGTNVAEAATNAATAPVWGGTQAQGRISKARFI